MFFNIDPKLVLENKIDFIPKIVIYIKVPLMY